MYTDRSQARRNLPIYLAARSVHVYISLCENYVTASRQGVAAALATVGRSIAGDAMQPPG